MAVIVFVKFVVGFVGHEFPPSRSLRALSAFAVKLSPNLTAKTRRARRVGKAEPLRDHQIDIRVFFRNFAVTRAPLVVQPVVGVEQDLRSVPVYGNPWLPGIGVLPMRATVMMRQALDFSGAVA